MGDPAHEMLLQAEGDKPPGLSLGGHRNPHSSGAGVGTHRFPPPESSSAPTDGKGGRRQPGVARRNEEGGLFLRG